MGDRRSAQHRLVHGHLRPTPLDALHLGYFLGYANWNYFGSTGRQRRMDYVTEVLGSTLVNTTMLEPEVHDFRVHDMNVTIRLNLLGWQLSTFNFDLDMGKLGDDTPTRRAIDGTCKRLSRRWVHAMTS